MDQTLRTYEAIAWEYEERHRDIDISSPYREEFLSMLKGKRVLDCGCASGMHSAFFAGRGFKVVGIDFSARMVGEARRRHANCAFKAMKMESLKFGNKKFDGVWVAQSFHHLDRKSAAKALTGFSSALKRGGILFMSTKAGKKSFVARHGIGKTKFMKGLPRLTTLYTKSQVREMLEEAGFWVKSIREKKRESDKTGWHIVFAERK